MEKLGIANEDLLAELRQEYQHTKEAMAVKLASEDPAAAKRLETKLSAIKQKIDEIEGA